MNKKNRLGSSGTGNDIADKSARRNKVQATRPLTLNTATWRVTAEKPVQATPFLIIKEQMGATQNSSFWLRTVSSPRMTIWRRSFNGSPVPTNKPPKKLKKHSTWRIKY